VSDLLFDDPPNVAVFSSASVIDAGSWIHYVSHDEDDGAWQFHSAEGAPSSDADVRVVSLRLIVERDPSLLSLCDLPQGWIAWRDSADGPWKRRPK
jgi:hypothetical protein